MADIRGIDRRRQHVGPQHHARAAAGRGVIDAAVTVGGGIPDVARLQLPQARCQRLARQADAERPGKHLGEQRENGGAPGHRLEVMGFHGAFSRGRETVPWTGTVTSVVVREAFRDRRRGSWPIVSMAAGAKGITGFENFCDKKYKARSCVYLFPPSSFCSFVVFATGANARTFDDSNSPWPTPSGGGFGR